MLALNLPTGVGKSAILRSIQLEFPMTTGIVPTNILMDQYIATYPELNYLKGLDHYPCSQSETGLSCEEMKDLVEIPCKECPYIVAKERARIESSVFNPISYYYFTRFTRPESKIIVVDEAHKLIDTLMLLVDISFRKGRYNYPEITNELTLIAWLHSLQSKLSSLLAKYRKSGNVSKITETVRQKERIGFLLNSFEQNPQDFVFYEQEITYRNTTDKYLIIKPIKPPKWLLDSIFGGFEKVVLMSATLTEDDLWKLGFKDYKYVDMDSPIPKENRAVRYIPSGFPMNYTTTPEQVAGYISKILSKYPNQNTIVHVSYSWSEKLRTFFPNAMFNTSEDKDKVLQKFKKNGGVWIASGCSEGLDLPDNECRLTIIPLIMLANIKDPLVIKQLSLPGGRFRYEMSALKTVIQQAGRGTRGENDYSITVLGDNKFPSLFLKNRKFLPKSFTESIIWSSN